MRIRILKMKVKLLKGLKVLVNSLTIFIKSRYKKCNRKIWIIKNSICKNKIRCLNPIKNLMYFIISCWKKEPRGCFSF
jgi:tRNA U54 and U55 pseudouridine synthase Pus10